MCIYKDSTYTNCLLFIYMSAYLHDERMTNKKT